MDSKVSSLFSILSNLYVIGRCDAGSVDEVCLRVLHKHVYETTADDFSNKLSLMRKGVVDLINHPDPNDDTPPLAGLQDLDPMSQLNAEQREGAMFFMRTATPTTAHVAETLAIYNVLKQMSAPNGPAESQVTYNGVQFTLSVANGVLTAKERVNIDVWQLRDGSNSHEYHLDKVRKDVEIPIVCPLDVRGFLSQIEDEIAANATVYGREAALALFNTEGFDAGSSRARQLALNVIAGITGTLATELCHVPTTDLTELARGMLQTQGDPKTFFK
jgi:hypothetical protein